jgi:hypothetical protein
VRPQPMPPVDEELDVGSRGSVCLKVVQENVKKSGVLHRCLHGYDSSILAFANAICAVRSAEASIRSRCQRRRFRQVRQCARAFASVRPQGGWGPGMIRVIFGRYEFHGEHFQRVRQCSSQDPSLSDELRVYHTAVWPGRRKTA